MANPTINFLDWAKKAAPYLALPALGGAVTAAYGAVTQEPEAPIQIGTEKDFGRLIGSKVYTGPKYGFQTIDTALTMKPEQASSDAAQQAEFRRLQQVLKANFGDKPPATGGSSGGSTGETTGGTTGGTTGAPTGTDTRTPETPTTTGIPGQGGASQTTDPLTTWLFETYKQEMDPARAAERARIDTENFIKRSLITNALSMQQTRENTKRQVELKNIEAWKALEQARIEANTKQAVALGQTVAAAMIPNQGLGQVLNQAYANAMTPFSNFGLK